MAGAETESSVGKRLREALRQVREGAFTTDEVFKQHLEAAHRALAGATSEMVEIPLTIATNRILLNEETVYRSESQDNNLAFDLFKQGLRRVTFRVGITPEEVSAFMRALAECRDASASDIDFVSTLWQEDLEHIRYVAIDGFTEKLFMSEEAFTRRFRAAVDDVVPGLTALEEEDTGDRKRRHYDPLDDFDAVEASEKTERENVRALGRVASTLPGRFRAGMGAAALDHLVRLHACVMVKDPQPLDERRLAEVTIRLLEGYLGEKAWEGFAAAVRSLWRLVEARNGFRPAVTARLEGLRSAIAGGPVVTLCAHHIASAPREFNRWARWFFSHAGVLQAPEILAAINQSETPQGTDFLKDLLHRQGTASLEPWAARLRDPNPGVVLEVLEVILQSPLGAHARPLLIECLRNADGGVRARAVAGLARDYDLRVREALLPLLKDEAALVRKEVVHRFVKAGDKSVAPYLASCIKGAPFGGVDEDEQRLYFEGLARLGGARFHDVFKEKLRLDGDGGALTRLLRRAPTTLSDDPLRRGAISALALLDTPEARALIQEVRDRAENALASHCEVALRLANREDFQSPEDARLTRSEPLEDLSSAQGLLGDRLIFEPADVLVPPPNRPRPSGAEDEPAPVPSAPAPVVSTYVADLSVPLAERPLLGAGERFDESDVRELVASPPISDGKRFRLTSPRAALVGVASTVVAPVVLTPPRHAVTEVLTPVSGMEIVGLERRTDPTGMARFESMDELPTRPGGFGFEEPDESPTRPTGRPDRLAEPRLEPRPEPQPERRAERADRIDSDRPTVEQTHERTVIRPPAPRTAPAARPRGLEALLKGYLDSAPPRGRAPEPTSEPPRPAAPVAPAPVAPVAPPPAAERPAEVPAEPPKKKNLDALLKGFLDLDLGDS